MIQSIDKRVEFVRRGLMTRRFHTVPTIGEQTVGQHSAGVALLIIQFHPNPSVNLLKAALVHDLSEWMLGDVPAQVKWNHSAIASAWEHLEREMDREWDLGIKLTFDEQDWLRACDTLELMHYAREQFYMGNNYFMIVWKRGLEQFKRMTIPVELQQHIDELALFKEKDYA